jgi:hypothetical protein
MKKALFFSVCIVMLLSCNSNSSDKQGATSSKKSAADSLATANEKLELEKEKLKLEKEKLELEKEKMQVDQKQRQLVVNDAVRNSVYYEYQRVVVVNKTYFHNGPDAGTQRKAYLVPGDQFYVGRIKANYVYTDFTNEANGKTTSGWILMDDIAPLDY